MIVGAIAGALVALALISFLVLSYRRRMSQTADHGQKMDLTHEPASDLAPEVVSDFPLGPQNGPAVRTDTSQTPMTTRNYKRYATPSTTLSYDLGRNS